MPPKLSRDEAIALVDRIMSGAYADDAELDQWLTRLERDLGCPHVSDLIFWAEPALSAPDVVERAYAYRPTEL